MLRQRVGQALCCLPEMENIDANAANTTFIGHSYFVDGSLVLRDLEDIVQRNFQPGDRGCYVRTTSCRRNIAYWKIIDDKTQCATRPAPPIPPSQ